jgi:hypothetical protein
MQYCWLLQDIAKRHQGGPKEIGFNQGFAAETRAGPTTTESAS